VTPPAADDDRVPPRVRLWLAAALVAGLGLRLLLVFAAPRYGYALDHFEILGMGLVASERGLTHAYSASPQELPRLRGWMVQDGQPVTVQRPCIYPPNYPPLATTVFWAQSRWLDVGNPSFVANTPSTRFVTSLVPWVFELATALAVGLLAQRLTGRGSTGAAAGALTWLAPPLMMNTGVFGQYDALALAPAVLAVLAMVRGRWVGAGIALGVTLLAKPQGLLMLPIAAFAALVAAPRGAVAFVRRLAVVGAATALTVVVGSAPWMLADGLAWLARCYRMNLFEVLPYTTLEAYNVWYLLALVAERQPAYDVLVSTATVAGLTRDAWGRVLLATALLAVTALVWRRHRRRPALATVLFAALWLWSVFIWPTRVHERYVLYCVPFLIIAAAALPRLRPAVVVLLVVATMEHGWMVWRTGPALGSLDRHSVERFQQERFDAYWKNRPVTIENAQAGPKLEESLQLAFERHHAERGQSLWIEWALTLLSLGAYAAAVAVALAWPSDDEPANDVIASA
jgi:Gpi18-like mannosyltransferase